MTRRESLKQAAGSFLILPASLARGYGANEKLDIGVIGLAGMGALDAKALTEQGDALHSNQLR